MNCLHKARCDITTFHILAFKCMLQFSKAHKKFINGYRKIFVYVDCILLNNLKCRNIFSLYETSLYYFFFRRRTNLESEQTIKRTNSSLYFFRRRTSLDLIQSNYDKNKQLDTQTIN